ncbi:MAG: 16S rRNA (guanine(527)-N(7))-methyltransferase RsmG [Anaerolineae bacterium]|nr:16S rRNA (guanine(527)-N(7))-methyltransferase RsmG [Thermoflexales bacterium]MDW8395321.1 16S rRNA (guanine(527)-N(7))-methyltransferase RsmG [Anaerolineae bacterium]
MSTTPSSEPSLSPADSAQVEAIAPGFELLLNRTLASAGLQLSDAALRQLAQHAAMVQIWNQRFNLTALTQPQDIVALHFMDSLTALPVLQEEQARFEQVLQVIDVGTGAGFPGIPLKVALPSLRLWLLDGTAKKVRFCAAVIKALGLREVWAIHGRAEELARTARREQFDVAIARAVAPLPTLVEYLLPLIRVGGLCIAMKGSEAQLELEQAQRAIGVLGGAPEAVRPVQLPDRADRRALVLIRKQRPTPPTYPRPAGAPRRSPLV